MAAGLVACGKSPAAPSPPPPPPANENGTLRVIGRVLDIRDATVAGAYVSGFHADGVSDTVSDLDGAYALIVPSRQINLSVRVEKAGFEPSSVDVFLSLNASTADVNRDLRLYQIVRVNAGDSVDLPIRPDDPICASVQADFDWPCRRVRVLSAFAGRLTVVPTLDPSTLGPGPVVQMQLPGVPDVFPPTALNVAVGAGSETIVELLLLARGTAHTTTLHTSLSR
jgi:hypothetical protein